MLLLICKYVSFFLVLQVIIYHAPYRSISASGSCCNYFNSVLTVKNIVYPVTSAYFYRIKLVYIKFFKSFSDMFFRKSSLIILI